MNKNIPNIIFISIIILIAVVASLFFLFIYSKKSVDNIEIKKAVEGDVVIGNIEGKRIERDSQYLTIKDDTGVLWRINITSETIFKKMLNLNDGDKIKIIGKVVSDKEINSLEIDSAK